MRAQDNENQLRPIYNIFLFEGNTSAKRPATKYVSQQVTLKIKIVIRSTYRGVKNYLPIMKQNKK